MLAEGSDPSLVDPPSPPKAKIEPVSVVVHGDHRIDPYAWLEDRDDAEVLQYLEAENEYAAAVMAPHGELEQRLVEELTSGVVETDISAPYAVGGYSYYYRKQQGGDFLVHCRRSNRSPGEPEEVLLDENALAEGRDYFALGARAVSPDEKLLAYCVDYVGAERFRLLVKDLRTGEHLPEQIDGLYYSVAWSEDSQYLFYTTVDEAGRPYRLFRHCVGSSQHDDVLLYEEPDAAFFAFLRLSKSRDYLFLSLSSHRTSEVWYLPADHPTDDFRLVRARQHGVDYDVQHQGDRFVVRTNEEAPNYKVMEAPCSDPSGSSWHTIIPHREDVRVSAVEVFADYLVVFAAKADVTSVEVHDLRSGVSHELDFPDPVYVVLRDDHSVFHSQRLRLRYTSLVSPDSLFEYDMARREWILLKRREVPGYSPEEYTSERIFAPADDGTAIPISIVHKNGFPRDRPCPLLLEGYGAYGMRLYPVFDASRLPLLERGYVFALAHVRGGGGPGNGWGRGGRLFNKMNTFSDFIASAELLVERGYTSPSQLVVSGASAGGLLVGGVANMRPELFKAVLAHVPFVDLVTTMLDPSRPLTIREYEEWGDPRDPAVYHYMRSYSPYDNVRAQRYPNMLVTTSFRDAVVSCSEAAKWVARLRARKTDDNVILLKTDMSSGHRGGAGSRAQLREIAFRYAFLVGLLGLEGARPADEAPIVEDDSVPVVRTRGSTS